MCRRYGSTVQKSIWDLTISILKQWKIYNLVNINQTLRCITFPNDSQIYFIGLDSEEKLLSIAGITDFFLEECTELNEELVDQIDLRLRAKEPNLQIMMCLNPVSVHNFMYQFCEGDKRPKSLLYIKSSYLDNPFLPQSYIDSIESLKERNYNKWYVYGAGNWGIDVSGLVFGKNTRFEKLDVESLLKDKRLEIRVGSDSGQIDPSTIVVSLYDKVNQTIYVIDEWYLRGATLDDHYNAIERLGLLKTKIVVDSADTRLINYLKSKKVNAVPTIKGKGSVEARIDYLLNSTIIIDEERCPNTAMEFQNFSWIKDKQTSKYTEKTTHEWSHTVDALCYAYNDLYSKKTVTISSKSKYGF